VSNVVPIFNTVPPGEVNEDIVEELERLLAEAKDGTLRGFAYCTTSQGDLTGTGWVGSDGSRHPLSSGILLLSSRYAQAMREGAL
jgi:hypothetical protein